MRLMRKKFTINIHRRVIMIRPSSYHCPSIFQHGRWPNPTCAQMDEQADEQAQSEFEQTM